jgi:catechol 2,3-dioxygenase-like lactoylglutathione lyase family enzyme
MFDHVTIRVSDRAASERFYVTVLRTLGIEPSVSPELVEWDDFSIAPAGAGRPITRGLHVGFVAPSRAHVDAFWRAGVGAGYRDDGAPGLRPQYAPDYYGGFLLDPDGNSAEAVNGGELPEGHIDHLWIRVADVAAARRFYVAVAPYTGFQLGHDRPELVQFRDGGGTSFSVVAGAPSEHVHLAFGAHDDATVEAFHRAATAAGYRDNGGPGERAVYHPGYYGAFVLDPDGNNVEVVNHNRTLPSSA